MACRPRWKPPISRWPSCLEPERLEHSLYQWWEQRGIEIGHKRFRLASCAADRDAAALLNLAAGMPLLRIQQTSLNAVQQVLSSARCRAAAISMNSRCSYEAWGSINKNPPSAALCGSSSSRGRLPSVPRAGIEPARPKSRDFKSLVSTTSPPGRAKRRRFYPRAGPLANGHHPPNSWGAQSFRLTRRFSAWHA